MAKAGTPIENENAYPTDIALSSASIAENNAPGATIGTLTATDPDAGQTHAFTLVSGTGDTDNAAFTITGTTLSINGSADYETDSSYSIRIRATDSGAPAATYEEIFTITITDVTIPQEITFAPLGGKTYGDAPFAVSATGGASGQPVTFTASGPATVSGSTVTITGAGEVTITAHQAGAGDYLAAADVSRTFTVAKAAQVLNFTSLPATATTMETVILSFVGGGSGNQVTFSVQSGPGSISGDTLTFTGTGSVVVRASQAGNANYFAAADVDRTVVVSAPGGFTLVDDAAFAGTAAITINVLANDPAGTTLTSVTQPTSGGVAKVEAGKVKFTPSALVSAPITFTYTAANGSESGTATVTVNSRMEATGNYMGLLRRGHFQDEIAGRVTLTVTSTGAVTGSVRREGSSFSFKGSITGEGSMAPATSTVLLPRPMTVTPGPLDSIGQPTLLVRLPDTVSGAWLTSTAERSPYNVGNPAPQAGRYTIVADLPSGGSGPQTGATMGCKIGADGLITFVGRLGNDLPVALGGRLLTGGKLPFYVSTGAGATLQRMGGDLVLDPTAAQHVTGSLRWSVPTGTLRLAGGVEQDYNAIGRTYATPVLPSGMFSPAAPSTTLTLTIPSLGLGSPVVRAVSMTGLPYKGVRRQGFTGGTIDLNVTAGLFRGQYTLPTGVKRTFFGAVLQGGSAPAGRGNLLDSTSIAPVTLAP